ncbi:MAG: hypothetical protein ACTSX0_02875 [Promethearchaeota archaeon]
METIKQVAEKTIINLPKDTTWDEIFYELYVVKKIEEGLKAKEEDKIQSQEEVKKRFLNT